MRIETMLAEKLPAELWSTWSQIQQANPKLDSAFFRPEFAQMVAQVRGDVHVGVINDVGQKVGFLPFHRSAFGIGRPLAQHLSDFQAVIAALDFVWRAADVIRGCGLSGWNFDHLLQTQRTFESFATSCANSAFIDVSEGFEAYQKRLRAQGSALSAKLGNLHRKIEKEVGRLRFEYHQSDMALLRELLNWKRRQYQETGVQDVFHAAWTVELLERLLQSQSEDFAGVLSVLFADDKPVAIHMGIRSRTVWHYWFPAYDPNFAKFSPGMLLLWEMIKTAPGQHVKRIDLGKGDADYKLRLMTGATPLWEGAVVVSPALRWGRICWNATTKMLRHSPLRYPVRWLRKWKRSAAT